MTLIATPMTKPSMGLYHAVGLALRERDGDLCQLCLSLIDFDLPIRTPGSRTVDHVLPVRAGGTDEPDNLWLAHLVCNQRKGARYVGRPDGTRDVRHG
jgi:5-methylcytosine-specific restriction endonuclease McrA